MVPMEILEQTCDTSFSLAKKYINRFINEVLEHGDNSDKNEGIIFGTNSLLVERNKFRKIYDKSQLLPPKYDALKFIPDSKCEYTSPLNNVSRPASPLYLNWHLTSSCSTDCRYCYLKRNTDGQILPLSRVLALLEEAKSIGVMSLTLLGGDVLVYPHLFDVLRVMQEYRFMPTFLSTKTFISKNTALRLSSFLDVIYELQFSIDSHIPEIADFLVGAKDFCSNIFKSIDNSLEAGINVSAKAVITPYNVLTVPNLYRELKKRGVGSVRLSTYMRSATDNPSDLFLGSTAYRWLNKEVEKLRDDFPDDTIYVQNGEPITEQRTVEERTSLWKSRNRCVAGREGMLICSDGKVIPCEQIPETSEYICGDVSYQSILDVWNGESLKKMTYGMPRENFVGQPCYDCVERVSCLDLMGICVRDLAKYYGNIYQPPPNCPHHVLPFVRQV